MTQPIVETLREPSSYTEEQITMALALCKYLDRGKLVLLEPPADGER